MEEIIERQEVCVRVVNALKDQEYITGSVKADIDVLYLQIRKMFELMMFASISAHTLTEKLSNKLQKAWNAEDILRTIERINPDFFPKPYLLQKNIASSGKEKEFNTHRIIQTKDTFGTSFLTKEEMKKFYTRDCNDFSHAKRENKYGNLFDQNYHMIKTREVLTKWVALLRNHSVNLGDAILVVDMFNYEGNVQVIYAVVEI